ncbi:MAG: hypothetical protein QM783_19945 [Phycisphaerales bacterium]
MYFVQDPPGAGSGVFIVGPTTPKGINAALEGLGEGGQRVVALSASHAFPKSEWAPNVPANADVIIIAEALEVIPR